MPYSNIFKFIIHFFNLCNCVSCLENTGAGTGGAVTGGAETVGAEQAEPGGAGTVGAGTGGAKQARRDKDQISTTTKITRYQHTPNKLFDL